jgi:hypothetical protein
MLGDTRLIAVHTGTVASVTALVQGLLLALDVYKVIKLRPPAA